MRGLLKLAAKILITVLLGGFLGATLVRLAPGFGVDEEELNMPPQPAEHLGPATGASS